VRDFVNFSPPTTDDFIRFLSIQCGVQAMRRRDLLTKILTGEERYLSFDGMERDQIQRMELQAGLSRQ
jgi:hypothetical protein